MDLLQKHIKSTEKKKQKEKYDLKIRHAVFKVGHRVLVKRTSLDGKHKLYNYCRST